MVLRSGVHEPDSVKNYADVSDFLNRYDLNLDEFIAAGGTRPSDIELKQAILRGLPQDLREALLLKATEPDNFDWFKRHIKTKVAFILQCRSELRKHHSPAHNIDHEDIVKMANLIDDQKYEENDG